MLGQKGGRTCVCAARAVTSGCVSGKWLGALASSAMPAASRPVGGLNGSQTGQAPAQFVRKTPAVCAAAASSDRGPRLAADSGACFRTRVELAGALPSPFGLGGASCGARGFKATAVPRKEKDLYKLLDVQRDASASDIKKAYFKMAKKYHPDVNTEKGAKEKFAEINKAYEILSDDQKRQVYDMGGLDEHGNENGFGGFGGQGFHGNPEDIFRGFEEMFGGADFMGGGGRGGGRSSRRQGADVSVNIQLSFMEAAKGCQKTVDAQMNVQCGSCAGSGCAPGTSSRNCSYCNGKGEQILSQMGGMFQVRQQCGPCKGKGKIIDKPCTKCRGQGKTMGKKSVVVDVPAGMDEGVRLRIQGEGEPGAPGQSAGNVLVQCSITPHPFFTRDGNNLYVTMPINVSKAILGGDIQVPTVDGHITVALQPGTQPNSTRTMRSKGLASLQDGSYGDLIITFKVVVPKTISAKQREVLEQFKADEVEPSGAEPNGKGGQRQQY